MLSDMQVTLFWLLMGLPLTVVILFMWWVTQLGPFHDPFWQFLRNYWIVVYPIWAVAILATLFIEPTGSL